MIDNGKRFGDGDMSAALFELDESAKPESVASFKIGDSSHKVER